MSRSYFPQVLQLHFCEILNLGRFQRKGPGSAMQLKPVALKKHRHELVTIYAQFKKNSTVT